MKLIDECREFVALRQAQISDKNKKLDGLKSELQDKEDKIRLFEDQYKVNFDETVFKKLKNIKSDKDKIEYDIKCIKEQLDLMDIGIVNYKGDVFQELDDYVSKELKLQDIRKNITNVKKAYIVAASSYIDAVNSLKNTMDKINSLSPYISDEIKDSISDYFNKHITEIEGKRQCIITKNGFRKDANLSDMFLIPEIDTLNKHLYEISHYITKPINNYISKRANKLGPQGE